MPAALSSRAAVLDALTTLFRERGFEGVSIADVSAATGLGRPSLYHYFPGGKDEMATAVIESIAAFMAEAAAAAETEGEPRVRLRRFMRQLDAYYAGGSLNCVIDVFGIGADAARRKRLAALVDRWLATFATIARDAGAAPAAARMRAERAVTRIQGALVLGRVLDRPAAFKAALADASHMLLAGRCDSA